MNIYLYDGSTEGLFSAIDHVLRHEPDPSAVVLGRREPGLFEEGVVLTTDRERADVLVRRFSSAFPRNAREVMYALFSEKEEIATVLLHYIHMVARHGGQVGAHLTHPVVNEVHLLACKVARELNRMKGLLRFAMLEDGSYLAKMEPDYNIIQPLSSFFTRRLGAQEWFIYDVGRGLVSRWDGSTLQYGALESFHAPALAPEEQEVRRCWKTFFSHIAIPERKNERLQKSCMPMKYWKYLVEKE